MWKVNEPERRFLRNYDRLWRMGVVIRRRSWTSSNPDFKPAILVESIIHPEEKEGPVILTVTRPASSGTPEGDWVVHAMRY